MLVLQIWRWDPKLRDTLQKMAPEEGKKPQFRGIKVKGKWHDLDGNRMFLLTEVNGPKDLDQANAAWLKSGAKLETIKVVDAMDIDKTARLHGKMTELSILHV